MNLPDVGHVLYAIEVVGVVAFAFSGISAAARQQLDLVGVTAVAGLAAFGGGTLRDLLLDRRPLFWVEHVELVWLILALAVAAVLFMRARHIAPTQRAMQWPDAIGMGFFSAGGTQIALGMEMPALVAVIMGLFTATFGGVLRDIVCNQIPSVFSDHRLYAICAFAGGWVLVACHAAALPTALALIIAALFATVMRMLAIAFNWQLPRWRME
ncbi:hypothetical protein B1C78_14635 [Thioalkalivibrio denitrificans]|uniref:Glycine transporter domain-containing protein n=1 Tax=Thioalkalivibrio denitrificans TaxID=108003 RepID=A0A1V3NCS5_9GAMM|nr:trimeric intracellular cation channel family protein [Thioalkalivibrio denitrificans]OOG22662.1 hypothetical protein B1C78_14635 [Thioalkalivibrio denitrificans]